jgi:hypothetical protein
MVIEIVIVMAIEIIIIIIILFYFLAKEFYFLKPDSKRIILKLTPKNQNCYQNQNYPNSE